MKSVEWKRPPNEFIMHSKKKQLPKIGLKNTNILKMDRETGAIEGDCKGAPREVAGKLVRKSEQMAT